MALRRSSGVPLSFGPRGGRGLGKVRLLIGAAVVAFALFSYLGSAEVNPITGTRQYLGLSADQEVALGLQAAPEMMQQHGGEDRSAADQQLVDEVGARLVARSRAREAQWPWEFHLLADPNTINAFALPGGQVFVTRALYGRLRTEGQLAGVLGHEIAHVIARHGSQRMAKANLTQGLLGAVAVASESASAAQTAAMIGNLVNMKYGREDELESDSLGVDFMVDAGYDPRAMIGVMEILQEAAGGQRQPEFMSTHPDPGNRIQRIGEAIERKLPGGVPDGLEP